MQMLKFNLDGSAAGPAGALALATQSEYLAQITAVSAEEPGYLVILGAGLDSEEPTERAFYAFAANGVLLSHNLRGVSA